MRRRYEEVDPGNRLVAAELERTWEASLKSQRREEEALNRFRAKTFRALTDEQRDSIQALSSDFHRLWHSPQTSNIERQNLIRILIDRIEVEAVNGTERLSVSIHWSGGFSSQHESRRRVQSFDDLQDSATLVKRAQELYNAGYPHEVLASQLNAEGFRPAKNERFTKTSIGALMLTLRRRGLIRERPELSTGFWGAKLLANELGIAAPTLTQWRHRGWVRQSTSAADGSTGPIQPNFIASASWRHIHRAVPSRHPNISQKLLQKCRNSPEHLDE